MDVAQVAAKMTDLLDQFQAIIPDFTLPDPARHPRVAARARFGEQMVVPMIAAGDNYAPLREVQTHPPLQSLQRGFGELSGDGARRKRLTAIFTRNSLPGLHSQLRGRERWRHRSGTNK
jgi:hypothetical protein